MTNIDNSLPVLHEARYSRVYLSDSLVTADDWEEVPYLFCTELVDRVAPGMSEAKLLWHCGEFAVWHDGVRNVSKKPQKLERVYCKVEILSPYEVPAGEKPPAIEPDPTVEYTWFGTIEADEFDNILGTKNPPTADQTFTAYGLMRDLENTLVTSAFIANTTFDDVIEIPRGLTFNPNKLFDNPGRGNQTANTIDVAAGNTWAFFNDYTADEDPETPARWNAYAAVDYLLTHHSPKQAIDGTTKSCNWQLFGLDDPLSDQHPQNILGWYDIADVPTDRRNLKDILDELIDRRRFVGWYVYCDDTGEEFTAYVKVFSFSDKEIDLVDRNEVIAANGDQVRLDLLNKPEVDPTTNVTTNGTQRYDEIIVEGEPITSTFSVDRALDAGHGYTRGWDPDDEDAYRDAASNVDGYDDLSSEEQEQLNTIFRASPAVEDVYSRFVMTPQFHADQIASYKDFGRQHYVTLDKQALEQLTALNPNPVMANDSGNSPAGWWSRGARFLPYLPQESGTPEYPASRDEPFVLFRVGDDVWQYGDQLNADQQRTFSVGIEMLEDALGFRLVVGLSGGQQMIARDTWNFGFTPATTPESLDPSISSNNAVDYSFGDMWVTLAVPWDTRVSYRQELDPPNFTAAKRTKIIYVPDARLDIRLPYTVIGVNDDGTLKRDEFGALLRDDRDKLESIGKAAAAWYGTLRQAVTCVYSKVTLKIRPPEEGETTNDDPVSLGTLVTKLGVNISRPEVNSPITQIAFRLGEREQTTTIQTQFYEGEFV